MEGAVRGPEQWTPPQLEAAPGFAGPLLTFSPLRLLPPCCLLRGPWDLTSDVFISSISASVGAFSRTRGRGRGAQLPASVRDRLMQEVDVTSPEQALRMQGREPNPGGSQTGGEGGGRERGVRGGKEGGALAHPGHPSARLPRGVASAPA